MGFDENGAISCSLRHTTGPLTSLSRRRQDTEKSSCSERRRPRRHQQISAMTVRQDRSTQCGKIRCQFLRLPDSIASLPIRIPAWISRSLGSLRWGCSMQGGDFRGHLRNQFLTSTSAWENLFLRPATRSGKSASDIWTYCHKSIYPEAQKGRCLLNRRSAQSII